MQEVLSHAIWCSALQESTGGDSSLDYCYIASVGLMMFHFSLHHIIPSFSYSPRVSLQHCYLQMVIQGADQSHDVLCSGHTCLLTTRVTKPPQNQTQGVLHCMKHTSTFYSHSTHIAHSTVQNHTGTNSKRRFSRPKEESSVSNLS